MSELGCTAGPSALHPWERKCPGIMQRFPLSPACRVSSSNRDTGGPLQDIHTEVHLLHAYHEEDPPPAARRGACSVEEDENAMPDPLHRPRGGLRPLSDDEEDPHPSARRTASRIKSGPRRALCGTSMGKVHHQELHRGTPRVRCAAHVESTRT